MKLLCRLVWMLGSLMCVMGSMPGWAQTDVYPNRPLKLVVPYPPGGFTDILGRLLAERLGHRLGQQVVVENKGGGGSTIGSAAVAKAPADGYTLLIVAPDLAINPSLIAKLPYSVDDFTPITLAAWSPMVVALHPSLKIQTPKELLDYARAKPNALRFASGGNGTGSHLALELFKSKTAVQIIHVPYRGVGPATTDLLGGQVDGMFLQMAIAKRHAAAGKLQAIATPSPARVQAMADVPTLAETVSPGFEVVPWFGVVAPAGTPAPIVQRLHAELQAILGSSEVKSTLSEQGAEAVSMGPEPFARFIRSEVQRWGEVIKQSGVKVD
jgi:tripartite-type tricarboxylate transporter receptor subunit TctC